MAKTTEIRPVSCEVVSPRPHGPTVYPRSDPGLIGSHPAVSVKNSAWTAWVIEETKRYPSLQLSHSVGEGGPCGPGRREIGHGALRTSHWQ